MSEFSAGRGGSKRSDSQPPADAEDLPLRTLRTVFQRRSPEEQALRNAMLSEVQQMSYEPRWEAAVSASESGSPTGCCSPKSSIGLGARFRQPAALQDGPLSFSSAFECGNLACAKLVCPPGKGTSSSSSASPEPPEELEYDIYIDGDTQSPVPHSQWFYFSVRSHDFKGWVHFRVVNMKKKKSLYQHGLQPHVHSVRSGAGWQPFACREVSYVANSSHPRYMSTGVRAEQHTLLFSYHLEHLDDEVYFASYPPYSYSALLGFLGRLERDKAAQPHFRRCELCRSIGQLPVPLLVVSQDLSMESPGSSAAARRGRRAAKPTVAVIARQHPGEVVGSLAVQGLLKFLLGPSPSAQRLREAYVFHIVPMVNVDGVVHGNSRCTLAGVDPNRVWHDPNPILHPVIYALKGHLRNVAQGCSQAAECPCKGLDLFLDLHGHSAKFGCFFYGCSPAAPISNALFPKLCAIANSDVSFEQSHWRCGKSHKKTARYVVHKQIAVQHSYTLECSLFAPVASRSVLESGDFATALCLGRPEPFEGLCFSHGRMEWVGCTLGRAAASFLKVVEKEIIKEDNGNKESCAGGGRCPGADGREAAGTIAPAEDFLLDLSCAQTLAARPWLSLQELESTTPEEVLEALTAAFGDRVPENCRVSGDGSDEGGDSDGDEAPEPMEPEAKAEGRGKEAGVSSAQNAAAVGGMSGSGGSGSAAARALRKPHTIDGSSRPVSQQRRTPTARGSPAVSAPVASSPAEAQREEPGERSASSASGTGPFSGRRVRCSTPSNMASRARSHDQGSMRYRRAANPGLQMWFDDSHAERGSGHAPVAQAATPAHGPAAGPGPGQGAGATSSPSPPERGLTASPVAASASASARGGAGLADSERTAVFVACKTGSLLFGGGPSTTPTPPHGTAGHVPRPLGRHRRRPSLQARAASADSEASVGQPKSMSPPACATPQLHLVGRRRPRLRA